MRETQLGSDHLLTAASFNNLASLYADMGCYSEAEPLFVRSLQICETQLGNNHPDIANIFSNLALLYQKIGCYSEAEPLYLKSLEISVGWRGENHRHTRNIRNNYRYLIQQMVESDRTQELSSHPITQALLQQIREAGAE
ncbi:MAG: tetratricopeptide repeat protein [Leptolyngbyaceae cyanobacterium SM1_4_3]|nr:tetratricopeptide repeat protein [Leptolyngbyaceae cyanobacterium SM1_4_3]